MSKPHHTASLDVATVFQCLSEPCQTTEKKDNKTHDLYFIFYMTKVS